MRSYNTPSLTVREGCLWVAYKDPDHIPRLARTYIADGVDGEWTNMWTGPAPTPGHIYHTFSGPAVTFYRNKFYLAWRRGREDGERWGIDLVDVWSWAHGAGTLTSVNNSSWKQSRKTEDAPRLVVYRDELFVLIRCKDNWVRWHRTTT